MQIPSFAQKSFDAYRKTGSVPGLNKCYPLEEREGDKRYWQSMREYRWLEQGDESHIDLWRGKEGEVCIQRGTGTIEASYSGDSNNGEMIIYRNTPDSAYGWRSARLVAFKGNKIEILDVGQGSEHGPQIGPTLTVVDKFSKVGYYFTA